MTLETLYNIGDKITDEHGEEREIVGVHIWVSNHKQTERYFVGNDTWITVKRSEGK